MNTTRQTQVQVLLEAVQMLCDEARGNLFSQEHASMLLPMRVLLDAVEALMNGDDDARARKNAGDRERRAKRKSPGKKPKLTNPPLLPRKPPNTVSPKR